MKIIKNFIKNTNANKPALYYLDSMLTYSQLNLRSERIAGALKSQGICEGDIVTILLPRDTDAVCSILGIIKLGAAFCVIGSDYPHERIDFIKKDTNSKITIDEQWLKEYASQDYEFIYSPPKENSPAIAIYTSGSTGNPKGVLISYRALLLALEGNILERTSKDIFLSTASLSFVAVVLDVLTPLFLGATLHIATDTTRKDVILLEKYIRENNISTTFMPPQMAKPFLDHADGVLRILVVGSEKVRNIYSKTTKIYNTYGASETCGPLTYYLIDKMYDDSTPIGFAYSGSGVLLLDEHNNLVAQGEGEICIWGQIASKYINLPEITAEKIIRNPFSQSEEDKTLYKTGDMGYINENGALIYVQRKDWMVKVRGFRVEPGEIEAAILRFSPANQAVVKSFENAMGETGLFAVYTAKEPVLPEEIKRAISVFLPNYMIPAFIEQIDSMPLNQNGKIDRKNILPPNISKFTAAYVPPTTHDEEKICRVFSQILGVEKIGIDDDFNLLGGDSISAAKAAAILGKKVVAADIISMGTPRLLAQTKQALIQKSKFKEHYPLTFTEQQMATEQGIDKNSTAYNINLAFKILGTLNKQALQNALNALIMRRSILRSYYPLNNGEFSHKISVETSILIQEISCNFMEIENKIKELNTPFDISAPPLLRCNLFDTNDGFVLHFCIHHIIMDGASANIFINELWQLYEGNTLPDIELEYTDFALWQNNNKHDEIGNAFFKKMFADGVPENEMPTMPIRPEVLPFADVNISCTLPFDKIKNTANKFGISSYSLLMAVVGLTLAKYCGTEDVVLGTAMNGRTLAEQEGMVGMFVNTLPLRLKPLSGATLESYLLKTSHDIRQVKAHQTYPFEQIVPMLAPDRNTSRSPVFDVIVNYLQEMPIPQINGLNITRMPIKGQELQMDLIIQLLHEGDNLRIVLSYSRSLYLDEIIENFLDQFICILEKIHTAKSNVPLAQITALPKHQQNQILFDFAGKKTIDPQKTVVDLFIEQAARTPKNKAVIFQNKTITYSELEKTTNNIAAHLTNTFGAKSGEVVGILISRSEMMPICSLGVLKTGAAYLPLDPAYPSDRLEYMLKDSGAKVVIADIDLEDRIPEFDGKIFYTKDINSLASSPSPKTLPKPQDLLILLYTSGTTGNPKGVMLHHRGLVNYIIWYSKQYNIDENDNTPAYASFGFDACMQDMYPILINGGCLHIIPEEMRLDLPGIEKFFTENKISVAFMTTQLGRQFAENCNSPHLRAFSTGGEALVPLQLSKNFSFHNLYGPTECTIVTNHFEVDKQYDRIPIGSAVDNTSLYVIDTQGELSPVGVAGELCISGRQVAHGYLNRPDLTEEKFIANPFTDDKDHKTMYKTGDVVRFLPDGNIDFVGRRDFQVKIRGFRVELTEIEGRIREYPGILDAAVIAIDDASGGKRVVAYIVSRETVEIKMLNRFIEEVLPVYMVPSATMQIEKIPLNQNGKVNRKALPQITIQIEEIVLPSTPLQKDIMEILKKLVGDDFGITTDLMYAGLNSLSSIKAAALICEKTNKTITTRELMREKTVEKIAEFLEKKGELAADITFEQKKAYPLTQNQLGLYFACVKEPGTLVYNIPFVIHMGSLIDTKKLAKCITQVIEAHPYVKTHITLENNQPMQLRLNDAKIDIPIKECSQSEFEQIKQHFVRPFNFFENHLFRIEILCTPTEVCILCDFHHIIFDGGSMDIFLRDLVSAWNGIVPQLEKFTSFDLALREKKLEGSKVYNQAKTFFHTLLENMEGETRIPKDKDEHGAPNTVVSYVKRSSVDISIKGFGITAANHFLAAVALVISRFASQRQARIASITNGREGADLQNNLGMLVKTLPTVIDVPSNISTEDYCKKVQERMFDTMDNQSYPYVELSSDYHYNAQILYAYQGGVVNQYNIDNIPLILEGIGLDKVKFPININIFEEDQRYRIETEYDSGQWDVSTMQTFSDCIANMAEQLTRKNLLGNLSIATTNQLNQTNSFSGKFHASSIQALNHMFEEYKVPQKTALIAADATLTYAQLDALSNRLANALISKNVNKEDRIAFMLPRDSRAFIAMLGIMKAGGCYIPIDPEYPTERITHILKDSGAKFILTASSNTFENSIDIDELLLCENEENPYLDIRSNNLCYIIYTSGSTGKPKGVMVEHGNIINYVLNESNNRHVQALIENDCTMCSVTTVSFDMFLKEAFTVLMNGLTLVFADDEESKNPVSLAKLFQKTGATAFNATPSRMLQYMELEEIKQALNKCKVIMAGGEKFPPVLYTRLKEITSATLINTYGPTEITVSSNAKVLTDSNITIGAPLHNVVEHVMDIDANQLPIGVVGELYIGGAGVARGYFNNEAMTKERFIEKNKMRFYKSGDLAKWTQNGEIIILGRNDGQIKLRGLRIEIGEIENAIHAVEEITSCTVVVKKLHGQEHLCAYYTAKHHLPSEELRDELLKTLTKYMVPTAYLQLDALPVTPNGKTDTKALPLAKLMQKEEYIPPSNKDEEAYCNIFKNILHLEKVGATDNFFDLGGTSLLVTQITIDALQHGYDLSYGDVFANPSPRELAALHKKPAIEEKDLFKNYDYSPIDALLKKNNLNSYLSGQLRELGNICLTGATGFLGIHILKEFITNEKGTAYCIVRGESTPGEMRLKSMLVYYFSNSFDELFGSRIIVINGDVTNKETFNELESLPINTLINCAANVKHFSAGTDIEDINVGGTANAVAFCKKKECRLVHISTASVAGLSVDNTPSANTVMDETMLYFGQDISNQYVNSKFLAEQHILEECLLGLDGKIMRVGNLMARAEDGEFQANFNTNSFLGKLKAYYLIGKIPFSDMSAPTEFAPIDCTATAVLSLAKTPISCRIFHPYNDHNITMGDVVYTLKNVGINIDPCESEEYQHAYSEALRDKHKAKNLNALIAYSNMAHGKSVTAIKTSNYYTSQILLRQDFKWPITSDAYLSNFFDMMSSLGFFDNQEDNT